MTGTCLLTHQFPGGYAIKRLGAWWQKSRRETGVEGRRADRDPAAAPGP